MNLPKPCNQPGAPPPCTGNCRRAALAELRLDVAARVAPDIARHLPDARQFGLVVEHVTQAWATHLRLNNGVETWPRFWRSYVARVEPEQLRPVPREPSETEKVLAWWWREHAARLPTSGTSR